MVWIEIVCDGCNDSPFGESYKSNSVSRLKKAAKDAGWRTINGKIYCPECQNKVKEQ